MLTDVLTQADFTLDQCARPRPPREDLAIVPISKSFLVQGVFLASTTSPTQTLTKEITGEVNWELTGIQFTSSSATAIQVQIQLPGGRFLINVLQDVLQIAGYGSYRYAFRPGRLCPPGTKITVTLNVTNTTDQQPIAILFDGFYHNLVKARGQRICPVDEQAANIPRYFGHPNQNIMAPAWQMGVTDPTPSGFRDEEFTYSAAGPPSAAFPAGTPGSTVAVTAANLTTTQQIQLDASEFLCSRLFAQLTEDDTVTSARVLVRIRLGSGQSVFDDYLDLAQYVGSVPWPIDLIISPNEIVYADLQLVDVGGTGNVYWTLFLEGIKRWRKQ